MNRFLDRWQAWIWGGILLGVLIAALLPMFYRATWVDTSGRYLAGTKCSICGEHVAYEDIKIQVINPREEITRPLCRRCYERFVFRPDAKIPEE